VVADAGARPRGQRQDDPPQAATGSPSPSRWCSGGQGRVAQMRRCRPACQPHRRGNPHRVNEATRWWTAPTGRSRASCRGQKVKQQKPAGGRTRALRAAVATRGTPWNGVPQRWLRRIGYGRIGVPALATARRRIDGADRAGNIVKTTTGPLRSRRCGTSTFPSSARVVAIVGQSGSGSRR